MLWKNLCTTTAVTQSAMFVIILSPNHPVHQGRWVVGPKQNPSTPPSQPTSRWGTLRRVMFICTSEVAAAWGVVG